MVWHASETPQHHSRKSYQIGNTIKNFQKPNFSLLICDVLNYDAWFTTLWWSDYTKTLHSLLKSLVFHQTLSFRKSNISYSIFGFIRRILSNRVVYNHCQLYLNSYKLIQCLFIIKKPSFTCENFSFWKIFKVFPIWYDFLLWYFGVSKACQTTLQRSHLCLL